jgi:hypothetical protein
MPQIIKRKIIRRSHNRTGRRKYRLQEPVGGDSPEIKRPPDFDIDPPADEPLGPTPPFTGEDVERHPPDIPLPM